MNERDYVLAAIRHQHTGVVPYTLPFDADTDKELDAYYGSSAWRDRLMTYMQCVATVDTAMTKPFGEGLTRDAFGVVWRVDQRPQHVVHTPLPVPDVDAMPWPRAEDFSFTLTPEAETKPGRFTYCSVGWGLFERSWVIHGFENVMRSVVLEEDFYTALLDRITELYVAHVARCAPVQADAIMFADDWGDQRGIIIGPERWRKLFKPRWARLYEAAHAQGKLVMSHCCGSFVDILPDLIEIGLDVIESVQPEARGMDPFALKRQYGDKICFWGCLGSQSDIPFGTPASIKQRVRDLCRTMGQGGGFMLAPAKSIQPGTPPENMAAVVEAFAEQNP